MEIPMTAASAKFLLAVVRYYTERENIYAESPEAVFLLDLIARLERRIRRGVR